MIIKTGGTEVCCGINVTFGFSLMKDGVAVVTYTIME